VRRVLHLDVDEHPGAQIEDFAQGRDARPSLTDLSPRVAGEEPKAFDDRIVVDDERPVGTAMDVELDPVGALIAGGRERGEGVLERVPGRTPVPEHEWTGVPGDHGGRA
jgi:hypothetical protein